MTHKLYSGYWYQRTSLHLSEIYDFLRDGTSPLPLAKEKLQQLQKNLAIARTDLTIDILEYVTFTTEKNIVVKIYEDGLVIITKESENIKETMEELSSYYVGHLSPALSYLFSLGAPVPKELVAIKNSYPFFVVIQDADGDEVKRLMGEVGEEDYFHLSNELVQVYRGDTHFVINKSSGFEHTEQLIEMLIFFSEFKGQLHNYLNLHRTIWEKIQVIKEQGAIKGRDIQAQRAKLESYKKTVELIEGRMQQMGLYIETRASIIANNGWEQFFASVLSFKYQNLKHTLEYVMSLWQMTKQYVDSAIQLFSEASQRSTKNSVDALTIISSIGVISGVIAYLQTTDLPTISVVGVAYFVILLMLALMVNSIINFIFRNLRYKISDVDYSKDI